MNFPTRFSQRFLVLGTVTIALASAVLAYQASLIPASRLMNPDELVKLLQSSKIEKPLMIQVGSHVLYRQAHIPGSEYIGPGSSEVGLQSLRQRVQSLPRNKFIVLYCGCCPWGPLSERQTCRRRAPCDGLHQREGALHGGQLRGELGR